MKEIEKALKLCENEKEQCQYFFQYFKERGTFDPEGEKALQALLTEEMTAYLFMQKDRQKQGMKKWEELNSRMEELKELYKRKYLGMEEEFRPVIPQGKKTNEEKYITSFFTLAPTYLFYFLCGRALIRS